MGGKRVKGNTGKARPTKQIAEAPAVSLPSARHLVWRFGRLDHTTSFSCQTLLRADAEELERELAEFQDETIPALKSKRWLKYINRREMTPDGRSALAEVSQDEEGLWQLHLKRHKWRIWGYFDDPEFFFVFWDCDHNIATGKSRTRSS